MRSTGIQGSKAIPRTDGLAVFIAMFAAAPSLPRRGIGTSLPTANEFSTSTPWGNATNFWGNAVENSALPRGNLGVTPWKTRRYPRVAARKMASEILWIIGAYFLLLNALQKGNSLKRTT